MRQALKEGQIISAVNNICDRESVVVALTMEKFLKHLHNIPLEEIEELTDKYSK